MRILRVGARTVNYLSSPRMRCAGGIEIRADSGISYQGEGEHRFIGNVQLLDGGLELRAGDVRYLVRFGRLQATNGVSLVDSVQGFAIENGQLNYLLASSTRRETQLRVTLDPREGLRPRATLTPRPPESASPESDAADPEEGNREPHAAGVASEPLEAAARPSEPYDVEADVILVVGSSRLRATGRAVVSRDSLTAYADTAEYGDDGALELYGSARVESRTYGISADAIGLSTNGPSDRLIANGRAWLAGADMDVKAPGIAIGLSGSAVDWLSASANPVGRGGEQLAAAASRPVALDVGDSGHPEAGSALERFPTRPVALSGDFHVTADSIRAVSPGEVLEAISAFGGARMVAGGRELDVARLPEIAREDWIEGDSVSVAFLPPPTPSLGSRQSGVEPRVDRVTAWGRARSVYRIEPENESPDSPTDSQTLRTAESDEETGRPVPGVHYVVAQEITIVMADGEVDRLVTRGSASGYHFEPASRADSIVIDTTGVQAADTARSSPRAPPASQEEGTSPTDRDADRGRRSDGFVRAVKTRRTA